MFESWTSFIARLSTLAVARSTAPQVWRGALAQEVDALLRFFRHEVEFCGRGDRSGLGGELDSSILEQVGNPPEHELSQTGGIHGRSVAVEISRTSQRLTACSGSGQPLPLRSRGGYRPNCGPNLADFGPGLADIHRICPMSGRCRPGVRPAVRQLWPRLDRCWTTSARFRPNFGTLLEHWAA